MPAEQPRALLASQPVPVRQRVQPGQPLALLLWLSWGPSSLRRLPVLLQAAQRRFLRQVPVRQQALGSPRERRLFREPQQVQERPPRAPAWTRKPTKRVPKRARRWIGMVCEFLTWRSPELRLVKLIGRNPPTDNCTRQILVAQCANRVGQTRYTIRCAYDEMRAPLRQVSGLRPWQAVEAPAIV